MACLGLLAWLPTARASSPRLHVQGIESEPAAPDEWRVSFWASPVQVEGKLLEPTDKTKWTLQADGTNVKIDAPTLQTLKDTNDDIAIVIVVQVSIPFTPYLEAIGAAAKSMVKSLPENAKVGVIAFGEGTKTLTLGEPAAALRRLGALSPDDQPGAPKLQSALSKAVAMLSDSSVQPSSPEKHLRKIIVVVSDGQAENMERPRFRKLGSTARDAGIVIDPIGLTPLDDKGPLLNLGEIAKRSRGTFRWARSITDAINEQFRTLGEEITKGPIISFVVPESAVAGKKLKLIMDGMQGEELPAPPALCKQDTCSPGVKCVEDHCVRHTKSIWRWLWWVLAILVVLVGGFFLLRWYANRLPDADAPGAGQTPGGPPQPGPPQPGIPGMPAPVPGAPGVPLNVPMAAFDIPPLDLPANLPKAQAEAMRRAHAMSVAANQAAAARGQAQAPQRPSMAPQMPAHMPAPQLPQMQVPAGPAAVLMVMGGPQQGMRIPIMHGFTIGKQPGCHFIVNDGFTSNHHAQFVRDAYGNYAVNDMNSTNGTFVNGVRIRSQGLTHGNVVTIGKAEFRYLLQ